MGKWEYGKEKPLLGYYQYLYLAKILLGRPCIKVCKCYTKTYPMTDVFTKILSVSSYEQDRNITLPIPRKLRLT